MHLLRETWYCIDLSQTGQILPLVCPEFFVINAITVLFFSEANGKEFARNTFKTLEIVRAAFERMPYFFTDDNLITTLCSVHIQLQRSISFFFGLI